MAKMKLKQLRDADVRFISLVDRAATRIPFRVLKREKESKMGIDLTGVFKSDDTAKPFVSALVVFAQEDEAAGNQVQDAIKKHGFITDRVQKSDEGETLVYGQREQAGDTHIVRLSDQLLVSVGGMTIPEGWVGEMIEKQGFFPDLKMATAALHEQMTTVAKSETPQEDAQAVLTEYAQYLDQVLVLPAACYALDETVNEIVAKCECKTDDKDEKTEVAKESPEEKKKRVAKHPPAEMAPVDEEDDQKPPPDEVEKTDLQQTLLAAIKGLEEKTTTQLAGVVTKLEAVVTEQAAQKKTLDDVVQKTDTFGTALKTTVTAPPMSEDRMASVRMRVQKDDDPRRGNFDTAFLRRRK